MNKLELTEEGNNFRLNLNVCLKWLFIGGEIKTSSGHRLAMHDNGQPGFRAIQTDGQSGNSQEIIFQIGSETSWMYLVDHAKRMTEKDRFVMAGNVSLNEQ